MARSCGIRLGPRRYEIVVLDGTAKKHRIKAFKSAEFDPAAVDPVEEAVDALREAIKELNVPKDNVGLVIDSGHAAFRHLTLPFDDPSKIDQILKYEVESKLPQWNIDDVVVDYHVIDKAGTESELLVTAVPKDDVRATLDILEEAGVEALEAELETTAMVNAAFAASLPNIDSAQLLVHVGDVSTSVVLVDGAHVREMRVIHIGALTHDAGAVPAAEGDDGDEESTAVPSPTDPIEIARRHEQATKRIRRELGRTLSGARTRNPIDAIYICGMELPGLVGSTVLDVPVYILDCFEEDGGQPVDGFGELVVAYGAAFRQLGGGMLSPSLRREDLRYAGTWERIEFPLAVTSLLLVTLLGVVFILQMRKLEFQERSGYGYWLRGSNLYMVGDGGIGRLNPIPEEIERLVSVYAPRDVDPKTDEPAMSLLQRTNRLLRTAVDDLEKELGQDAEITQPQSAFVGMQLVLSVLEPNAERWRPSIRRIQASTMQGRSGQPDRVEVVMNLVFFAEEYVPAVNNYEAFRGELASQEWFVSLSDVEVKPLENEKGCEVNGLRTSVDASWYYEELKRQAQAQAQELAQAQEQAQ